MSPDNLVTLVSTVVSSQHDPQVGSTSFARAVVSSATVISRILNFCTFPVTVIGNSLVNLMYRGILKVAIWPRQKSRNSSAVAVTPLRSRIHAQTSSPYL